MKSLSRLLALAAIIGLITAFFATGMNEKFTFSELKTRQAELQALYHMNPAWTIAAYLIIYIASTALSLPGATILTLAGGALFGLGTGLVLVSFASTIGATLAMVFARFLLRDFVENKFRDRLAAINAGLKREGGFYLFTLRLIPLFPFFVINLAMGLTKLPVFTFFWVSQIGMLPGTLAYVNAGTRLAELESPAGIIAPEFLLSFAALGFLPLIGKRIVDSLRVRKVYRRWKKPKSFDYNMIVIGAGSGGLISAYIAAAVKAKVALIEADKMGGDCLNRGCVPSKALLQSAKVAHQVAGASRFGIKSPPPQVDFPAVMKRIQDVIKHIEPNDSVERYRDLGVDCHMGYAKIKSPWEIEVNGGTLTSRNIVIATGAHPLVPKIPGLDKCDPLTSDNLWDLKELPKRLLVLGGGPIGCEMAQAFRRLGSEVSIVEMRNQLLRTEEPEAGEMIASKFQDEGMQVFLGWKAVGFGKEGAGYYVELKDKTEKIMRVGFDRVLVALGREANVNGFGLEDLGIELNDQGRIQTDEYLRTNYPNIYAVGDVAGPYLFTHASSHQAWHAAVNSLFGQFKKFKIDYSNMPWCTFTEPEVARVGLSVEQAEERGVPVSVHFYDLRHLDRAVADGTNHGFIKLLVEPGKDKILGATIVGPHAGDMMAEIVLAKRHGLGLKAIMAAIHTYPTLAEGNKLAAGVWTKATAPQKILGYLEKYHRFRR